MKEMDFSRKKCFQETTTKLYCRNYYYVPTYYESIFILTRQKSTSRSVLWTFGGQNAFIWECWQHKKISALITFKNENKTLGKENDDLSCNANL